MVLGAALRLYHLDFQSVWGDEALSMIDADPSHTLKQLFDDVLIWEQMPHLYFFLLRFCFELFGYTIFVGRFLSAVFGIAGIFAIYVLAKELYGKRAGLIAALFLSVNYFHIAYSQEMRPYGMFFMFTLFSFYRLVLFIKQPTMRNAIFYGIVTAFIIHSHLFGMVTIFSQCIILLIYLIQSEKSQRKTFLVRSLIAGGCVALFALPAIKAIRHALEMKSFWLGPPTPTIYSDMMNDFFGKSEMVLFATHLLFLFFAFSMFRQKEDGNIRTNRNLLGIVVLGCWMITTLLLPLLKSYLDVSMIISRYFIGILGLLVIVLAFSTHLIRNTAARTIVIAYVTIFSVTDLLAVKKYYTTVSKTQLRELTQKIKELNPEKTKVVAFWGWIFPHFFQDDPAIKVQHSSLDDYVAGMRNGNITQAPFWYADCQFRPYQVTPETQAYLDQNFRVVHNIELYDAWARHYLPINVQPTNTSNVKLDAFNAQHRDGQGNILMFDNSEVFSPDLNLEAGRYKMTIKGKSLPEQPINGENAHFVITLNGKQIHQFNMSEKDNPGEVISFTMDKPGFATLGIKFDNDYMAGDQDRNAIIYAVTIDKQ